MSLLQQHPKAVVGEFGIDRAAVIPGTKVRARPFRPLASCLLPRAATLPTTHHLPLPSSAAAAATALQASTRALCALHHALMMRHSACPCHGPWRTQVSVHLDHQLALVRTHLELAARFDRPVSIHCVRGIGPLQVRREPCARAARACAPRHVCPPAICSARPCRTARPCHGRSRTRCRLALHAQRPGPAGQRAHCTVCPQDLLASMASGPLPPRIMMHSFGGSPESVQQVRVQL